MFCHVKPMLPQNRFFSPLDSLQDSGRMAPTERGGFSVILSKRNRFCVGRTWQNFSVDRTKDRLIIRGVMSSAHMTAGIGRMFCIFKSLLHTVQRSGMETRQLVPHNTQKLISGSWSVMQFSTSSSKVSEDKVKSYDPPSPYRNPGPRRFGYEIKLHKGGLLPRLEGAKSVKMPRYEPKDSWNRKRALFGQNDYIDILGDGDVRPYDLLKGPRWLLGFKGNEMQRIIRQLKFEGPKLKYLYPTDYNNLQKRLKFLYKRYNHKRSHYHR